MTEPGYFELYNNQNKADTCTTAVAHWNDVKTTDSDGPAPEACAVLTSHAFQAYSWYLQDLSDGIIGAQTEKMTETLAKVSGEAEH